MPAWMSYLEIACVCGSRHFDIFHVLVRYLVTKRVTSDQIENSCDTVSNKPRASRGDRRIEDWGPTL